MSSVTIGSVYMYYTFDPMSFTVKADYKPGAIVPVEFGRGLQNCPGLPMQEKPEWQPPKTFWEAIKKGLRSWKIQYQYGRKNFYE